jgi:hypothetical protein
MGKIQPMKGLYWLLIICVWMFEPVETNAQTKGFHVTGTVQDTSGNLLSGASVILSDLAGLSVLAFTLTDQVGKFHLDVATYSDSLLLRVEHIESASFHKIVIRPKFGDTIALNECILPGRMKEMPAINIKAPPLSYRIISDTLEFRAKSYRTPETRKVEDLFRNMQGFQLADDGKVYFMGKEVDRILFDGEDLADRNYRLLSRNLNADLVDRVQVIDNYHPDRLMQSIERSGRIAVNLSIDSSFKFRVSGTVSLASSGNRNLTDANLVFPARSLKALSFLNYNKVGTASGTQLSEDRLGETDGQDSEPLPTDLDLLETVSIAPPPLESPYVRDNEDFSAMQVLSFKGRNGQSVRWLAGMGKSRLQRFSEMESEWMRLNGNKWRLLQADTYAINTNEALLSFRYLHDAGASRRGQVKVILSTRGNEQTFQNETKGDLLDRLTEDARKQRLQARLEGSETFRNGSGSLLRLSYQAEVGQSSQDQRFHTERFLPYQFPFAPFTGYQQGLNRAMMAGRTDLNYYLKKGKSRWSAGIRFYANHERQQLMLKGGDQTTTQLQGIHHKFRSFKTSRSMLYVSRQININRKLLMGSGIELGTSGFNTSEGDGIHPKDRFLNRIMFSLDYKASMMNVIGMKLYRNKSLPSTDWFHVGPFLNADGQIRIPATIVKPEVINSFSISLSRMNLPRSFTAMIYFSATHQSNAYLAYADRSPGVYNTTYAPFDRQHGYVLNGSLSKHFPSMFLKIMTETSVQTLNGETVMDGENIFQSNSRFSFHQRLISAVSFPINMELTYTANRISNRISTMSGSDMVAVQWQHIAVARVKYRFVEKGSMTLMYAYRILQKGNSFQTIDLYTRWKATKSFSFSLTGHNLTDARMLALRSMSLNATTDQRVSLVGRYILLGLEWSF